MTQLPETLGPHTWITDAKTRAVMEALGKGAARFVGGCVRNTILGEPVDDIDIATVLTPEDVIAHLEKAGIKAVPTGIDHGTITAVVDGKPFEITTLRKDVTTDGRHAEVAFTADWAEDAARRDFTMNALYAERDGTLHDPVGGYDDAKAGRVRFIGDANARIQEDYLRILRFFRFSAWYGKGDLDAAGLAACGAGKDGLKRLSGERVQKEVLKLLGAREPMPVLRAMAAAGVLVEVLPEAANFERFAKLVEIESHQLFTSDPVLRLGAILSGDAQEIPRLAERLKLSNADRDRLSRMHTDQTKLVSYLSIREVRKALYWMGVECFKDRVMLHWAVDPKLNNAVQWRALLAIADSWERPTFPLTGEEVMAAGVPEGPQVGRIMREVEEWWVDVDFIEDRLSIVERLKAVVQATVY
jgi:poly(A) polymerase